MVNPWLILGIVLAFLGVGAGCYTAGDHEGHKAENQSWTIKVDALKVEAANAKIASDTATLAREHEITALNVKLETNNATSVAAANAADGLLRDTLSQLRQRQKQPRCGSGGGNNVPANPGAGVPVDAAGGSDDRLSEAIDNDHRDTARAANVLAAYARACNAFAVNVSPPP